MRSIFTKLSIIICLFFLLSCNTRPKSTLKLHDTDTLGILKASLDSSFIFAKNSAFKRTADTSAFTSEFRLDTIMRRFFSKDTILKLKYLDNDSLCRIAHELIAKGIHSDKVTNLIAFSRDSIGDYRVALERERLITMARVINGDTIKSCEFGGALEWIIFLRFKKIGNGLLPKVEHWEIHYN